MTDAERKAQAVARMRETRANPFRRRRRANQSARYINTRQAAMHPSWFDQAGNPTGNQS